MPNLSQFWPDWGDSGEAPPDGTDYESGDNPKANHYDYLWDTIRSTFETVETRLNAIDSDDDGTVDEADSALTYKGNDIDSDGDGVVDESDDTTAFKGNDIDSDGDGIVNEADDTTTVKGNDIDSDGDGVVDEADEASNAINADDADTVDGQHASALENSVDVTNVTTGVGDMPETWTQAPDDAIRLVTWIADGGAGGDDIPTLEVSQDEDDIAYSLGSGVTSGDKVSTDMIPPDWYYRFQTTNKVVTYVEKDLVI